MKLAIVDNSDFSGHPIGGAASFVKTIWPYLANRADLTLVGPAERHPSATPAARRLQTFVLSEDSPWPDRLRGYLGLWRVVLKHLGEFDVAYVHSPELVGPSKLMAKRVILHLHGLTPPLNYSRLRWARVRVVKWAYAILFWDFSVRRADLILAAREDAACTAFRERHGLKVPVLSMLNPVDTSIFVQKPFKKRTTDGAANLLYVGRLSRVKRVDIIIRAAHILAQTRPLTLYIVGRGEELEKLQDVSRIGQATVVFTGAKFGLDLAGMYREADVTVLASEDEGLPTTIVESLACGTSVVAPNVGGISRLIQDGVNGWLVDLVTPQSLAKALDMALDALPLASACCNSIGQSNVAEVTNRIWNLIQAVHAT